MWERERTRWFIRWDAPEVEGVEEEQNHLPVSTHMATDSGLEIWQYRQWYSGREGLDSIEDREEEEEVVEEASSESDSLPSESLKFTVGVFGGADESNVGDGVGGDGNVSVASITSWMPSSMPSWTAILSLSCCLSLSMVC